MADVGSIGSEVDSSILENSYEKDYIFDSSLVLPPYHKDPKVVQQEVKTNDIAKRIVFVESIGNREHVLVDGAVHVEQNTPEDRQKHVGFWQSKVVKMIFWTAAIGVAMIATAVVGVQHTDQLWPGLGFLAALVIEGGFFARAWNRWDQANDEVAKWKVIPANVVAQQRQEAFGVGFFSAMRFNMKGQYYQTYKSRGLLHPQELDYLYRESFKSMRKELDKARDLPDIAKGKFALRFIHNNPLSQEAWSYVFDDVPSQVFSAEYERMESKILNIKEWYNGLRSDARSHYDRLVRENQQRYELAKAPFKMAFEFKVAEITADYERKALQHKAGDPPLPALEAERNRKIGEYKALYEIALIPIKMYYDGNKQQLDHWKDAEIARIDQDELHYVRPLFDGMDALFSKAYARFIEGNDLSKVVSIKSATSQYQFQAPSALPEQDLWKKVSDQSQDSPYRDYLVLVKIQMEKEKQSSLYPELKINGG
ncbi:MAG: hypothetical protein JSR58_03850 [Verrucomicrobia bacterium]|nr:hypothetical protein [Verrucomicrobiota bacterium]